MPKEKKDRPALAQRILLLRKKLKLGQVEFSQQLEADQGTISKWETGKARPTPEGLVRLASIADGVDKLFFLEEAGLPEEFLDGVKMTRELRRGATELVARAISGESPDIITIPLLSDSVAAGNPRTLNENEVIAQVPFLRRWLPRNRSLYALKVSGDSMAPIVNDGYVVIVDTSQQDAAQLVGKMVAAREQDGITIKWLRKDKDTYLLVPQHVSPRIPVRIMRPEDHWAIVGVVVKWIGYPPPSGK